MSKIQKKKISQFGKTITGKTPPSSCPEDFGVKYMFITPPDFSNNKFIDKTERYLSETGKEKLSSKLLPPRSILITCIGYVGKIALNKSYCITNQQINSIITNNDYDPDYLYYVLKHNYKLLANASTGSTVVPILNKTDFDNLELLVHDDFQDQQKISSVLSTLDSKIELNNKINTELEAMAKTLYDYWFVQFDFPDENGKPYKSSGGEMVWSEELKREIPKEWQVKKLKNILKKNNKKFNLNNEKHNIDTIDLSVMPSSTMCLTEKNTSDEFGTNLFEMSKFDILFGGIRPYLLKAGFAPFDGLVTGTVHSFNVINKYDYNFALLTMIHESMFQFAISNSKGTKMPVVGSDDLLEYKVPYNEEIVKKFNQILGFKEIISKNIQENQKLAELRDFLLPMLMNGQVVVE